LDAIANTARSPRSSNTRWLGSANAPSPQGGHVVQLVFRRVDDAHLGPPPI
jgi:hypothetical protein